MALPNREVLLLSFDFCFNFDYDYDNDNDFDFDEDFRYKYDCCSLTDILAQCRISKIFILKLYLLFFDILLDHKRRI